MRKKLLSWILTLVMLGALVPATEAAAVTSGKCGSSATWSFSQSTGTLTISGRGAIYDYGVEWGITAPWGDYQYDITSVVVKSGITHIGKGAFGGEFGGVNDYPSLTSVTLPNTLKSIGMYAFGGAPLTSVQFPTSLTTIDAGAFCGVPLKNIDLPDSLTTLGYSAFSGHEAASVHIPANVREIGERPFGYMAPRITVDAKNPYFSAEKGVLFDKEKTTILSYPSSSRQSIYTIPDTVTTVDLFTFAFAESLKGLVVSPYTELTNDTYLGECYTDLSEHFSLYFLGDAPQDLDELGVLGYRWVCFDIYYVKGTSGWEKYTNQNYWSSEWGGYTKRFFTWDPASASFYQVPSDKYQFRVVDGNGAALPGVQVTYDTQSGVTDASGMVLFDAFSLGTPAVTATLSGYTTWSNANSNWSKKDSRCETIVLYPASLGGYKLETCAYSNLANLAVSTDLLTQTKTLNLKNTGNLIGDLDFGYFYLTCQAAKTEGIDWYELRQGNKMIAQCGDGNFGKLSVTQFSKGGGVTVRVVTTDGKTVDTPINLQFAENKVNSSNSIKIMNGISFEVDDDIPYFGGSTVKLDFDAIPGDFVATDEGIRIGFNCDLTPDGKKDRFEELKKTLDKAKRAGNLPIGEDTKAAFKQLMKDETDFALPGAKFKAHVIGYAEADWGSTEAKGELYLLLEAQTKTFGFNTVVVIIVPVPFTVQVKAFAKFQAGGEIAYNWSTNQVDGGIKLDITVGLDAFTGPGVGEALGAGAYGQADVNVAGQLLGSRQGIEKVDLTGELGLKAYAACYSWEKSFAYNTWHLYTRNDVHSLSLDEGAALLGMYDASQYRVESLDYLRDESGWLGDSISLMSADANTTLTPLLAGTYRNAQPVMVQAGNFLYAAFLRGDAESGHVSVWVTRFDGTSWAEPVQADSGAILDDAPTLCADGSGNVWLAYARTAVEPGDSLLTYAQNQSIVVGKIDPETLQFTEKTSYTARGYAHLQQLTVVNGQPVLVWADSEVTNEDSVLFPQSSCIYTAAYNGSVWGEAGMAVQVDKPIWQLTAGEQDGALTLAYIQDMDGDPDTETDHDLWQLTGETTRKLAQGVRGNVTFGTLPGQSAAGFIWNAEDTLCSENGSVTVPGITGEYAVVGDNLYYSTATGGSADLAVMQYQDGQWGEPIQLTDGNRYLENLSAARLNGRDYVLGMHTRADIWDTVEINKNLVWAVVQPVSDLRLESASYDVEAAAAGAEIPVTLSVCNAGDHEVSSIDILCGEALLKSVSCALRPGESTEFTISMTCPEVCTEYTFTVVETDEDDFTPDDNSRTLGMGYADVSVELSYEQVGTSQTLVAVLTNRGVETASGTLFFTDTNGNCIGFTTFEGLGSGDAALSILPLEEDFGGTVSVLAELDQEELYTYNNTARQAVIRMTEPTVIRSVKTSGTRVVAQLVSAEETACTAYCAVYDAYGKLLEITSSVVSPGEHTLDFTASVPFASAEVFLLNADSVPLCESVQG